MGVFFYIPIQVQTFYNGTLFTLNSIINNFFHNRLRISLFLVAIFCRLQQDYFYKPKRKRQIRLVMEPSENGFAEVIILKN